MTLLAGSADCTPVPLKVSIRRVRVCNLRSQRAASPCASDQRPASSQVSFVEKERSQTRATSVAQDRHRATAGARGRGGRFGGASGPARDPARKTLSGACAGSAEPPKRPPRPCRSPTACVFGVRPSSDSAYRAPRGGARLGIDSGRSRARRRRRGRPRRGGSPLRCRCSRRASSARARLVAARPEREPTACASVWARSSHRSASAQRPGPRRVSTSPRASAQPSSRRRPPAVWYERSAHCSARFRSSMVSSASRDHLAVQRLDPGQRRVLEQLEMPVAARGLVELVAGENAERRRRAQVRDAADGACDLEAAIGPVAGELVLAAGERCMRAMVTAEPLCTVRFG